MWECLSRRSHNLAVVAKVFPLPIPTGQERDRSIFKPKGNGDTQTDPAPIGAGFGGARFIIRRTPILMVRTIVFEGSDGCGKSTQMQRVAEAFKDRDKGWQVHCIHNPGGTPFAEHMRTRLLSETDYTQWDRVMGMLSALSSTANHILRLGREDGLHMVLLDRWLLSTLVYQGCVGGVTQQSIMDVAEPALGSFMHPDAYLVYQVPAEVALDRVRKRGGALTVFEERVKLEATCAAYRFAGSLVLAPTIEIDGAQDEDTVWVQTANAVFGPQ